MQTDRGPVRIGTRIRINRLDNGDSPVDDSRYDGREGFVTHFDGMPEGPLCGMHGTWGGLAVYPTDDFEILEY